MVICTLHEILEYLDERIFEDIHIYDKIFFLLFICIYIYDHIIDITLIIERFRH